MCYDKNSSLLHTAPKIDVFSKPPIDSHGTCENLKIVEKTIRPSTSVEYCELRGKIFGFFIVGTRKNPYIFTPPVDRAVPDFVP